MRRLIEAYRNKKAKKVYPPLPGKFSLEFDIHQAATLGMGSKHEIESRYSYKEILTWVLFGVFENASERAQYPETKN